MTTARAPRARRTARGEPRPVNWGEYAAAVHRWELLTGRAAPYPTQPGRHGRPVLAPPFVEWLMGLPSGWVTAGHLELPRTGQLRALGNGVMPQQAAHALRHLLDDLAALAHAPARCHLAAPPHHPRDRRTTNSARCGQGTSKALPATTHSSGRARPARSAPAHPTTR